MICTWSSQDAQKVRPSRPQRSILYLRGGWDDPNCARPTRAFSSRALREHGDRPSHPAPFFNILLMGDLLAAEINLPYALIRLDILDGSFANDGTLVQDRYDTGDLPYKIHVVLDDDDRLFLRQ
jgi:hypothetical protein